ncbi:MAG TPA: hypothetical protein VGX23_23460 [Actinocrinis sp.]|nr:hypothetical protein [Actinocrinis sp.]
MSPVSRSRKSKKKSGAKRPATRTALGSERSAWSGLQEQFGGPRERPVWFDEAIAEVLGGADALRGARGPRELEQAGAELIGAQLQRVLQAGRSGLWLDWWFEELVDAALARFAQARDRGDEAWQGSWLLLHALTSLGSPALASMAQYRINVARKRLGPDGRVQPAWLRQLAKIAATGEVWQARDVYGGRFAVIAGFEYPGGTDSSVFLFDIDASGFLDLISAGVYDDLAQAAAAWRDLVGDSATADPVPVRDVGDLACLVQFDSGEMALRGDESRARMDNWYRADRRVHDLAHALDKRGTPLQFDVSLYDGVDLEPMADAFAAWHVEQFGTGPGRDAVLALAEEWSEGALPGTQHVISPRRIEHILALVGDWLEDPVTEEVKALFPRWVRWHGEQAGLPEELIRASVELATTSAPAPADPADPVEHP